MNGTRSAVTTHVLDTVHGRPAVGVEVRLETHDGSVVATGRTDDDGRVSDLGPEELDAGAYRIRFDVGAWFDSAGVTAFYPEVLVAFVVDDGADHLHVPLLLSPFGYSTYRGS